MHSEGSSAGGILQQIESQRKSDSAKGRWHMKYEKDTEKEPRIKIQVAMKHFEENYAWTARKEKLLVVTCRTMRE